MTARRARTWVLRTAGAYVVLAVALAATGHEPRLVPLAAVVLLAAALLWLVHQALPGSPPRWQVLAERRAVPPGQDQGTARWVRLIEGHQSLATPDDRLQQRLAGVVDRVLRTRHGHGLDDLSQASPEHRTSVLGPEVVAVLDGPPRRLRPAELTRVVERIEAL